MTDFSAKWFDRNGRSKKSASLHHAYYRPGKSSADFTLCKFAPRAYLPNFYAFWRKFAVRWGSDPLLAPAPKFCTPPPRRLFLLQVDHRWFRKSAQRFYEGFSCCKSTISDHQCPAIPHTRLIRLPLARFQQESSSREQKVREILQNPHTRLI